jgi:competence protein ComEA
MRRALASDHQAAVERRLELLSAELATVRGEGPAVSHRSPLVVSGTPDEVTVMASGGSEAADDLGPEGWVPGGPTRVRASPWQEPAEVDPVLPRAPGRHASRRMRAGRWGAALPASWAGRWALGAGQIAVVAVGAVVGLVLTCWWLVRSSGHDVTVPSALPVTDGSALATPVGEAASPPPGAGGPAPSASGATTRIVVDVTGKVRHPGIVVLRSGSRVVDAVRAAGGPRPGTGLGSLNLARVLTDGEQIVVGNRPQGGLVPVPGSSAPGSPVVGLVDLNTADQTALESLPEIGPVTAQAILAWRTEHGGFTAVSQLLDVDGIGEATLAKLTPYVTV